MPYAADMLESVLRPVRTLLGPSRAEREAFILDFRFPPVIWDKLCRQHPELTDEHLAIIQAGLRQWLVICAYRDSDDDVVGMPSLTVDWAWHEFILCTRSYHRFCQRAFGQYLHHTPAGEGDEGDDPELALERTQQRWERSRLAAAMRAAGAGDPVELYSADASILPGDHQH